MGDPDPDLDLRAASMDDAEIVAELEGARNPDDPRDPTMLRFWWAQAPDEPQMKLVAERDGSAIAFIAAGHEPWEAMPKRFGWIRPVPHPDGWSAKRFGQLIEAAESWLRDEEAAIVVARSRDQLDELAASIPTGCLVQAVDLRERDAPAAVVAAAVTRFGRLDLLVNNAGATKVKGVS